MPSVMQDWTTEISMMQQTVLLTAVRGPDGLPKYGPVKYLLRWFRRCVLLSAMDGRVLVRPWDEHGGSFTGPSCRSWDNVGDPKLPLCTEPGNWESAMDQWVDGYLRDLDAIPHHFQLHFMHACEIVGYKHPDDDIRGWWRGVYTRLVNDMHLTPETEQDLDRRLGDSREGWLARADKATVA